MMKHFAEQLTNNLDQTLLSNQEESNILHRYGKNVQEIRTVLEILRANIREHTFKDLEEETHYFRFIVPPLYAKLLYYQKVYQMEIELHYAGKEKLLEMIRQELMAMDMFNSRHGNFCLYYFSERTAMDQQYFTRGNRDEEALIEEIAVVMDADYCVGSYWAAKIIANRDIRDYIEQKIFNLENPSAATNAVKPRRKLKWKRSKTDAVELCQALQLTKAFGDITLKEIVDWLQDNAEVDLPNYHNTLQEIRMRKKGRTQFSDEMRDKLNEKFDEME